jgi:hypothetical protein
MPLINKYSSVCAAGLVALAWYDSFYVALLLGSVLGTAWLRDWIQGPKYTGKLLKSLKSLRILLLTCFTPMTQ